MIFQERSSAQNYIASIVACLVRLIDSIHAQGKTVVMGATNSIASMDGLLRREGRFDRELLFALPDLKVRFM